MFENYDVTDETGFEPTGEVCPDCGGEIFQRVDEPSSYQEVTVVTKVCESNVPSTEDCSYYEEDSKCPDCGGELEGDSSGPDRISGAHSGKVSCTECDFGFYWSE